MMPSCPPSWITAINSHQSQVDPPPFIARIDEARIDNDEADGSTTIQISPSGAQKWDRVDGRFG